MKIIVFGDTNKVGMHVIKLALARGYYVKAFGRDVVKWIDKDINTKNFEAIKGYLFEEEDVNKALLGVDAVISCIGGSIDGVDRARTLGLLNILTQMNKLGIKKIAALGNLGVLQVNETTILQDTPDYPEELKAVSLEHAKAWQYLQLHAAEYSMVCTPQIIDKDGTGNYTTLKDYFPTPNLPQISAGDVADCLIKCINTNQFLNTRVGISAI